MNIKVALQKMIIFEETKILHKKLLNKQVAIKKYGTPYISIQDIKSFKLRLLKIIYNLL